MTEPELRLMIDTLQRTISTHHARVAERDRLLTVLHIEHGVKQTDLTSLLNKAAAAVQGKPVTPAAVWRAIDNQQHREERHQ